MLSVVAYPLQEDRTDWEGEVDLSRHVGPVLRQDSYIETGLTHHDMHAMSVLSFASESNGMIDDSWHTLVIDGFGNVGVVLFFDPETISTLTSDRSARSGSCSLR